jgi:hypothetical protein
VYTCVEIVDTNRMTKLYVYLDDRTVKTRGCSAPDCAFNVSAKLISPDYKTSTPPHTRSIIIINSQSVPLANACTCIARIYQRAVYVSC